MDVWWVLTYAIFVAAVIGLVIGAVVGIRHARAMNADDADDANRAQRVARVPILAVLEAARGAFVGGFAVFIAIMAVALVIGLGGVAVRAVSNGDSDSDTSAASFVPEPICDPHYSGACLDPSALDYDCASGDGNGPKYVQGLVTVHGSDPFDLDRDANGLGCE